MKNWRKPFIGGLVVTAIALLAMPISWFFDMIIPACALSRSIVNPVAILFLVVALPLVSFFGHCWYDWSLSDVALSLLLPELFIIGGVGFIGGVGITDPFLWRFVGILNGIVAVPWLFGLGIAEGIHFLRYRVTV